MLDTLRTITSTSNPGWGPTGKDVYDRTYSRTKADGTKENWLETVTRTVDGNLSLVDSRFIEDGEREALIREIFDFRIIPAGRHLWMSGVEGRQFLFNCYVSGWGNHLSEHFAFTFLRLMEGGGVGANYSAKYVNEKKYPVRNLVRVQLYCSSDHPDYQALMDEGLLTNDAFEAKAIPDSREGWARALERVIDTATVDYAKRPDGRWVEDKETGIHTPTLRFDLSNIRPAGEPIKTFGGTSAGPVPLARLLLRVADLLGSAWEIGGMTGPTAMGIDHEIANCVVSGNVRRSARMSIMHWNDPWIDWFLDCKKEQGRHWSTNISVEIDDEFIDILRNANKYANTYEGVVDHKIEKVFRVYHAILEGMLTNGEPGIWNSSLANKGEPNPVNATNPCGEICLEEWENCNLGHVNLSAFVDTAGAVDYDGLHEAHRLMTRFLMRATYGDITDSRTRDVVDRNRRIGVGHFGFAGHLAKRKIRFSDAAEPMYMVGFMLSSLKQSVDDEAISYAHQLRIPVPVKTTTVAPTGTIAKLPGESEGIHPIYARYFIRRIRYSMVDPDQKARVEEFRSQGYSVVVDPDTANTWIVEIPTKESLVQELEDRMIPQYYLESVDEISLVDMIRVQRMYQEYYADNAVSFTINVPPGKYTVKDLEDRLTPNLKYLKGTTVMVDESRLLAPYERISDMDYFRLTAGKAGVVDQSYDEACTSGACPVR